MPLRALIVAEALLELCGLLMSMHGTSIAQQLTVQMHSHYQLRAALARLTLNTPAATMHQPASNMVQKQSHSKPSLVLS